MFFTTLALCGGYAQFDVLEFQFFDAFIFILILFCVFRILHLLADRSEFEQSLIVCRVHSNRLFKERTGIG
ncbi:MAG: hypothetical protein CMM04_10380 [Rhodopirellula sp.]|nr:hypothetical protein [Rhodopirellula sp.]